MSDSAGPNSLKKALVAFVVVLILSGAIYSALIFFTTVRAVVAQTSLPFSEKVVQARSVERDNPTGIESPDVAEKKERITILLLGIDQRGNEAGPWRTDTMILVSVDPETESAGMLSIPRDLWVTIPGFGESRINMAHYLGDANDYPGGGTALAKKTIWHALGVPVDYYVRIDFSGFETLIDEMGGITIDVAKPIHDEKYPDSNYGTMVIDIPAGVQNMDGKTALQYARSRHGTGDFDRMARQQELMLAARDKVMRLDLPISRIPDLLALAGDSVKTDLPLDQLRSLAEIARRVRRADIHYGVIDDSMTTSVITPEKWMVEVADWDKVRKLVDDLFPAPVPSVAPTPSLTTERLSDEAARIVVQNGTLVSGLAQETAERLRELGFNVVRYANADRFDYRETTIVVYAAKQYTVEALTRHLGISAENVRAASDTDPDVDLRIILGRDYAQRRG